MPFFPIVTSYTPTTLAPQQQVHIGLRHMGQVIREWMRQERTPRRKEISHEFRSFQKQ